MLRAVRPLPRGHQPIPPLKCLRLDSLKTPNPCSLVFRAHPAVTEILHRRCPTASAVATALPTFATASPKR